LIQGQRLSGGSFYIGDEACAKKSLMASLFYRESSWGKDTYLLRKTRKGSITW
jgi:hypothetical protein